MSCTSLGSVFFSVRYTDDVCYFCISVIFISTNIIHGMQSVSIEPCYSNIHSCYIFQGCKCVISYYLCLLYSRMETYGWSLKSLEEIQCWLMHGSVFHWDQWRGEEMSSRLRISPVRLSHGVCLKKKTDVSLVNQRWWVVRVVLSWIN